MQRQTLWAIAVVLLLGIVLAREPRFKIAEQNFLHWLLVNSTPHGEVPLVVMEIGADKLEKPGESQNASDAFVRGTPSSISPLEFALFLQSILDYNPPLLAFESILRWRDRDKDQEQVFLDQAMRAPRLLLATELTATPEPDAPMPEFSTFTKVSGKRGALAEFSGVLRQPSEDLRLISTPGFINLPDEVTEDIRVPLLFQFRGEVIPSFPLQAIMIWLRVNPSEVKIELGSYIELPKNRRIPIARDGSLLINPNAAKLARRYGMNEFLYNVQQHDKSLERLRNSIILTRTPSNPLAPPDVYAATIATLLSDRYVHRVSHLFDFFIIVLIFAGSLWTRRFAKFDIVLIAIAFSAAYCLIALTVMSRANLWLPGVLPLTVVWLLVLAALVRRRPENVARRAEIMASPPAP